MLKYTWPVLTVAFLFPLAGCPGDKACDSGDSACETGGEGEGEGEGELEESFSASWGPSGVTIDIENGSGTYELGMAETDSASPDPWTGEDCYEGYTLGDGTLLLYCHPLSSSGGSFTGGGNPNSLDESSQTVFTSAFEDVITYYVSSDSTGECWVWGHDPDYYSGLGCTEL